MNKLPLKAIIAAVFCNILFGSASPMIKLGYEYFGITDDVFVKILYAGIRFFISGIIVFIISAVKNKTFPVIPKGNRLNIILLGIVYTFLQYTFFYIGLSNTTGASASVVNASSTFIAIIFAHFIYKDDKITTNKALGCIVGFAGVVIACFAKGGLAGISFGGEGMILITSLFFVIGSIINKRATAINDSFTATACNLLIGGLMLVVLGGIGCKSGMNVTIQGVLVMAYLIFVSTVGFTLWSMLLQKYPIGKLSIYNCVIPISGTILSGIFLHENVFTLEYITALILVTIGITAVNRK